MVLLPCRAADRPCKRPLQAAPPPPAGAACNQAARGGARSGQAPLLAEVDCQGDATCSTGCPQVPLACAMMRGHMRTAAPPPIARLSGALGHREGAGDRFAAPWERSI